MAYEADITRRWCNGAAHVYECVASPKSNEDKIGLKYRIKAFEDLNFNAGYSYAVRDANQSAHFMTPIGSTTASQTAGMDGKDVLDFKSFPYASRTQHVVSTGATWQATEELDFGLNGSYTKDNYDTLLGVQLAYNKMANIDASYSYNVNSTVSIYGSFQTGFRDMKNGFNGTTTTTSTQTWNNRLEDNSTALGFSSEHRNLLGGKMDLVGDLSYSLDTSEYSTILHYIPSTGACSSVNYLLCGSLPEIKSKLITFKLTDHYRINKTNKVTVGYIFEKRDTNDYYYNGYQYGYTPSRVMPTNEQAPTYTAHLVSVAYTYLF